MASYKISMAVSASGSNYLSIVGSLTNRQRFLSHLGYVHILVKYQGVQFARKTAWNVFIKLLVRVTNRRRLHSSQSGLIFPGDQSEISFYFLFLLRNMRCFVPTWNLWSFHRN